MNEDQAARMLADLGERVPVGPAPVDATLEEAKGNTRRRRAIQVVSAAAAVAVIAVGAFIFRASVGGSANSPAQQAACVVPFRFEGKVYTGFGYASEPPTRELGVADEAACDDKGPEAGVHFPENPRQVTVWAFEGVDPDMAIGVRDTTGDFVILVAEEIPESTAQRIADRLGPPTVDELSQHDGEFCPKVLPRAPRETYGFGNDRPAMTVPTLRKPQEAWICQYGARDVASEGSNGAWFEWVRQDAPRRLNAEELEAFSTAIEQLEPPTGDTGCHDDLGPRYLVSYAHGKDLTGVVIDDYGCHMVRLTDDPFTTVAGDPSQPGTVAGVLFGPPTLLSELNAG